MASSRRPLTFFPDLNTPPTPCPCPVLNYPTLSIKQTMAAHSNIDANHFTLKSCVEMVATVSNLSHWLQNRTSEVH
ncbi:hypothetical protein ACSBR2_042225 [Camellia fascicularis]